MPILRLVPFADIWVPHTTAKSDSYKREYVGDFMAILLLEDPAKVAADPRRVRGRACARSSSTTRSFQSSRPRPKPCSTPSAGCSRAHSGTGTGYGRQLQIALTVAACLFMLLPAVNLVNLNTSRIMERASEIGVRKAFGASSRTLVGQFVVENLVLTLVGGAVGFVRRGAGAPGASTPAASSRTRDLQLNFRIFGWGVAAGRRLRPALGRLPGLAHVAPASGARPEGSLAMIRHLFKLIWNRKRTNLLMMTEIFVSFLVLFAVVALAVYCADNWRRPLGFRSTASGRSRST